MKYIKVLIIIMFAAVLANSQSLFKLNYSVSFPNSNMKQYIDKTSYSGLGLEYGQYFSRGNYSLGASFGWNVFSEQYYGTTEFKVNSENSNLNGAITGNQVKYINAFPMLLTGTYYFKPSEHSIVPFVSLGTGMYFITQKYQVGVWELESNNWHFGMSSEAGMLFRIDNRIGFNTSAKLNYAFDSGESITGKADNYFSYWSINVGFTFLH